MVAFQWLRWCSLFDEFHLCSYVAALVEEVALLATPASNLRVSEYVAGPKGVESENLK